jgi:hypothetical protein
MWCVIVRQLEAEEGQRIIQQYCTPTIDRREQYKAIFNYGRQSRPLLDSHVIRTYSNYMLANFTAE